MTRFLFRTAAVAVTTIVWAASLQGQTPYSEIWTSKFERSYKVAPGSTIVIDNRFGNVIVEGIGGDSLHLRAKLTIRGENEEAIRAARETITLQSTATPHGRIIRTGGNDPGRHRPWAAVVDYYVRLPRTCNVAVSTISSDLIQSIGMMGSLQVQNFSGVIDVAATGAPMSIDTTNGTIIVRLAGPPREDSRLKTLNGSVNVFARKDLSFTWVAESINGRVRVSRDITTNVQQVSDRDRWVAEVNRGGKRLLASSMTGELLLGPIEDAPREMRPDLEQRAVPPQSTAVAEAKQILEEVSGLLLVRPSARTFAFQRGRVTQKLNVEVPMGNFIALELDEASIHTGAGEIIVGRARGMLEATTHGGPINIGETLGAVDLQTLAGDIMVNSTRGGGTAETGGGNIRIRESSGPLRLNSGGGDITVDLARRDVFARTKFGDITVHVPADVGSLTLDLRTIGGNVNVTLPPGLRASVEATVITAPGETNTIDTNVAGLDIVRDVVGDRDRIRARGAIGGGGPSLRIVVEGGNIRLRQSGTR